MSNGKSSRVLGFVSGALAAGALLFGWPARATSGTEPATAAEARQMADDSLTRAAQYRELGGVGFKNGLVQREDADAARYDARAAELEGTAPVPVTSPEADKYATLAAHYRFVGGAAFKTGLLQSAEADEQQALEQAAATAPAPTPEHKNPLCLADKPDVAGECPTDWSRPVPAPVQ